MPLNALEVSDVLNDELVACDDNVKRRFLHVHVLLTPELAKDLAVLRVAPVWNHLGTVTTMSMNKLAVHEQKSE